MVIPIEESLIYVRPLYLRGAGSRIPELTRVIVAYLDQIVMERTLDDGINRLFGEGGPARGRAAQAAAEAQPSPGPGPQGAQPAPQRPGEPTEFATLAAQARTHYENAIAAQRAGNWAAYGEEIKRLGAVLEKMKP
jgi:uncharacterized membrane protein (UPF0182 family)